MLVTIEGECGAGKTTQIQAVSHELGVPTGNINYDLTVGIEKMARLAGLSRGGFANYVMCYSKVFAYHALPTDCVVDDLWGGFFHLFECDEHDINTMVDVFRSSLNAGGRAEPDLTVYLHAPRHVLLTRRYSRDEHGYEIIAQEKEADGIRDAKVLSLWNTIADRVPFVHVVDGNQSSRAVTESILGRL